MLPFAWFSQWLRPVILSSGVIKQQFENTMGNMRHNFNESDT